MATATITSKGQVTLPKVIRDSLSLRQGDCVEFVLDGQGQALLRPLNRRVGDIYGMLSRDTSTVLSVAEMDAAIRGRFAGSGQ